MLGLYTARSPSTGSWLVLTRVRPGVQESWSGEVHSRICHFASAESTCSKLPAIMRNEPSGSRSVTMPSPTGQGGEFGGLGGGAPPLLKRIPASFVQVRSSVETAEKTCQP